MRYSEQFIKDFGKFYLNKAAVTRRNAGLSGMQHDGGASIMEREWELFLTGFNRQPLPERFDKHIQEFEREQDPEYVEYLRLQEKFGT